MLLQFSDWQPPALAFPNSVPPQPEPIATTTPVQPSTVKKYEVFIEVHTGKTARKATKCRATKDQPVMEGPISLDVSLSWAEFLDCIGRGLNVSVDRLGVRSFKWKLQKPATSPTVTLHAEAAYISMVRRISERPDKMPVITITMESPLKESQSVRSQVS